MRVPAVVEDRSTRRVLTSELAEGLGFEAACARPEPERAGWAGTLWTFVFEGLLGHALFNADPHPGNYVFVEGEGSPAWFLDFGCTRAIRDEKLPWLRATHRAAAIDRDEERFFAAFSEMIELPRTGEQARLGRDYARKCFAPIFARGPYRITRAYTANLYEDMVANARALARASRKELTPLPAEWLFFNRLQLGFYSVLARLDVATDYNAIERAILEEVGDTG